MKLMRIVLFNIIISFIVLLCFVAESKASVAGKNNFYLDSDLKTIVSDANKNVADAQVVLGDRYVHGEGVKQDIFEGIKWYKQAALNGNQNAQKWLGDSYYMDGEYQEAFKWYYKNAKSGDISSQYVIGQMYLEGKGEKKNVKQAFLWFSKAAEQNYGAANYQLGLLYANGGGVLKDSQMALSCLKKSLLNNIPYRKDAEYQIALIYAYGDAEVRSKTKAYKWFEKAALSGHDNSQYELAAFYEKGEFVQLDLTQAYKWYLLAAEKKHQLAILAKKSLRERLSREQILKAQEDAHNFKISKNISQRVSLSSGTGFFISSNGYLITASHVVRGAKRVQIKNMQGAILEAKIISANEANDIALLKVDGDFQPLAVVSSRKVRLGNLAFTVGFPNITIQGVEPKFNKGEISGLSGLKDNPRHFQTSVPIQPGNSGGPLVNSEGSVVGVLVSKLADQTTFLMTGAIPQNVNYAVKSSVVLAFLEVWPEVIDSLKEPEKDVEKDMADKIKKVTQGVVIVFAYS